MHEVLVNRLGGLRKSVVRLTDRPDMTLDVYCGRKTTMQQQCNNILIFALFVCMSYVSVLCLLYYTSTCTAYIWSCEVCVRRELAGLIEQ